MKSPGTRPHSKSEISVDNLTDRVRVGTKRTSVPRASTFPAVRLKTDNTNAEYSKANGPSKTPRERGAGSADPSREERRFAAAAATTTGTGGSQRGDDNKTMPTPSPRRRTLVNNFVEKDSTHLRRSARGKSRSPTRIGSRQSRPKSAKSDIGNGHADSGDSASDNSDSAGNEQGQLNSRPHTPWDAFQEQIKSIDDSSLILCFRKESVNFRSSETFRETMGYLSIDNGAETTETRSSGPAFGVRFSNLARFAMVRRNTVINEEKRAALKAAARRGWNKIRRTIQEAQMQRRNSEANMGWRFLQATMHNMTDMERARQDLYKRYLFQPPESEIDRVPPRLLSAQFSKSYSTLVKQRQNFNAGGSTVSGKPRARSAMPQRPKMAKRQSVAELFSDRASVE